MTLKEANYQVEKLENEITLLLNNKLILEQKVGIQTTKPDKIVVDGGKRADKLIEYIGSKELDDLDKNLLEKQERQNNLILWIERELKILKKYNKIEQMIVYYKEIINKKYTWHSISMLVNYSIPQCKRIYKKYKLKRNIDKDDTI